MRRQLLALVVALAACACAQRGVTVAPEPQPTGNELQGRFAWTELDGKSAPVEYPPGTGATLVSGSLELNGERFVLRFGMRPGPGDSLRVSAQQGRFREVADSLHFMPDGREAYPAVKFSYAWQPDGTLALTDARGHVWTYRRS